MDEKGVNPRRDWNRVTVFIRSAVSGSSPIGTISTHVHESATGACQATGNGRTQPGARQNTVITKTSGGVTILRRLHGYGKIIAAGNSPVTAGHLSSMRRLSLSRTAGACFAVITRSRKGSGRRASCMSTTITQQVSDGICSAVTATKGLAAFGMMRFCSGRQLTTSNAIRGVTCNGDT